MSVVPGVPADLRRALSPEGDDALVAFGAFIRRLCEGRPIPVEEAADLLGCVPSEVDARLDALSASIERDEAGRIVGAGLTLVPTPHRFEVDGRYLYVWCALDTLVFPLVLGRAARVESRCPATGVAVRLRVDETGVSELDPGSAVVSLVTPDSGDIRGLFCDNVHFYATEEVAPAGVATVPVADAFLLARDLAPGFSGGRLGRAPGEGRAGVDPSSCCGR